MIYRVDWIEKNLGITRKALRVYESKGLINPKRNKNNKKYREFSMAELKRIWMIRLLRELGFTLNEVAIILDDSNYELAKIIDDKIHDLQSNVNRNLASIRILNSIKSDGSFPSLPDNFGEVTIEDYYKELSEHSGREETE